jgi:selenocysteine-specific elongation factor
MSLGDESDMVERLVAASLLSGISFPDLLWRTGLSAKRLDVALSLPLSEGNIVQIVRDPRLFLSRENFTSLCDTLFKRVVTYLEDNPIKDGISREELKSRLPARSDGRFFSHCLLHLENERKVKSDRDQVRLPGRKAGGVDSNDAIQQKIEVLLINGGAEPPTAKELSELLRLPEKPLLDHLALLTRQGRAVKVKSDLFYAPEPLQKISETMLEYLRAKGEITPAEFREISGLSRKFMIPVLEYFDSLKMTVRVGDKRLLRRR